MVARMGVPDYPALHRSSIDEPERFWAEVWDECGLVGDRGGRVFAAGPTMRDSRFFPDARLSVMEIKWGLVPDMTGTQTLQRLVGLDVAKLLTFTGREVLGEEAVTLGLATQTSIEPVNAALALAKEIADKSPDAIRAGKRLLDEASYVDLATGLAQEAAAQKAVLGSPNQMEAVMAAMQKRAPRFQDPS